MCIKSAARLTLLLACRGEPSRAAGISCVTGEGILTLMACTLSNSHAGPGCRTMFVFSGSSHVAVGRPSSVDILNSSSGALEGSIAATADARMPTGLCLMPSAAADR